MQFAIDGEPGALVTISETPAGALSFTIEVHDTIAEPGDTADIADLRGLFFHVRDESLLPKLKISGPHVTSSQLGADAIKTVGGDVNMEGRTPSNYDVGVEFGTSGIGKDDIRSTTFTLDYVPATGAPDIALSLDLVANQFVGLRLTSVSDNGAGRELSLKLVGTAPAPKPADTGTGETGEPDPGTGGAAGAGTVEPSLPAGGNYDDLIEAGDGNDWIHGGRGNDEIQGEGGDDLIQGGTDNGRVVRSAGAAAFEIGDNLYGNDGNDTFVYRAGDGVDQIWDFQPGLDIIEAADFALSDIEVTYVREVTNRIPTDPHNKIAIIFKNDRGAIVFNDFPHPGTGPAIVLANGVTLSSLQLIAMAEANAVASGAALNATENPTVASGLQGIDRFGRNNGTGEVEWLTGAEGNDRLYGNEGLNRLEGLAGDDQLYGGNIGDVMLGGDGNDDLYSNGGDDIVVGGAGNDRIYGTGGADILYGDEEDGAIIFLGGSGDNVFEILSTSDQVFEEAGGGVDIAYVKAASFALGASSHVEVLRSSVTSASVNVLLVGSDIANSIFGHAGKDTLRGMGGNDTLRGGQGNDTLDGGLGSDALLGETGTDTLLGGEGNDTLRGGAGRDILEGGGGRDRMLYTALADSGAAHASRDVVKGFTHGVKIDLSALDANTTRSGNQAFVWSSAFTGVARQLVVTKTLDTASIDHYLVRADVNGDKRADFSIQIQGAPELNKLYSWDFVL
jgi:Ca2+-binding RTX toxin-like protein